MSFHDKQVQGASERIKQFFSSTEINWPKFHSKQHGKSHFHIFFYHGSSALFPSAIFFRFCHLTNNWALFSLAICGRRRCKISYRDIRLQRCSWLYPLTSTGFFWVRRTRSLGKYLFPHIFAAMRLVFPKFFVSQANTSFPFPVKLCCGECQKSKCLCHIVVKHNMYNVFLQR